MNSTRKSPLGFLWFSLALCVIPLLLSIAVWVLEPVVFLLSENPRDNFISWFFSYGYYNAYRLFRPSSSYGTTYAWSYLSTALVPALLAISLAFHLRSRRNRRMSSNSPVLRDGAFYPLLALGSAGVLIAISLFQALMPFLIYKEEYSNSVASYGLIAYAFNLFTILSSIELGIFAAFVVWIADFATGRGAANGAALQRKPEGESPALSEAAVRQNGREATVNAASFAASAGKSSDIAATLVESIPGPAQNEWDRPAQSPKEDAE